MTLHVFRANAQPLTRYRDTNFPSRPWVVTKPKSLWRCNQCHRQRRAENLSVQIYYDKFHVFCTTGCRKSRKKK